MNITPDIIIPAFEQIAQSIVTYIPRLITSILVLIVGFKIQPLFSGSLKRFFDNRPYDESLEKFLYSLFGIAYKIFIIVMAISIAGIETASIVAALGAAGFAVGLALQGSMSNFASGILILTLKPIKVGEYIEINSFAGTVHRIEIFNTMLLTVDNKTIIVPNSDLTSNVLINYSRQKKRRVDLEIGVAYGTDLEKAKKVLTKSIEKQGDLVLRGEKYEPIVRVNMLGDSAITFSVLVWAESSNFIALKSGLLEDIKKDLDKAKIEIPFPTITLSKSA